MRHFYNNTYYPAIQELKPAVRRQMMKQYPIIDTERRPKVLKCIDQMVSAAGRPGVVDATLHAGAGSAARGEPA